MSLIKRSDVKNHLSTRARGILLFKSSSRPDVTGQPGNQSTDAGGTAPGPFADRAADRGGHAPAAAMSTLPTDVANDREASAPSTRSGKPRS